MKHVIRAALVFSVGLLPSPGWAKGKKETAPRGLFAPLVKAGATWTLEAEGDKGAPPHRVLVETHDVRKVGAADVARLRYTSVEKGKKREDVSGGFASAPQQVAVTDKGAWFFAKDDDDAKIAEALKGPPAQADPPRLIDGTKRKDGKSVQLKHTKSGDLVCIGIVPGMGAGECDDVCFGDYCLSPEKGLIIVEGTFAPDFAFYAQPGFTW